MVVCSSVSHFVTSLHSILHESDESSPNISLKSLFIVLADDSSNSQSIAQGSTQITIQNQKSKIMRHDLKGQLTLHNPEPLEGTFPLVMS